MDSTNLLIQLKYYFYKYRNVFLGGKANTDKSHRINPKEDTRACAICGKRFDHERRLEIHIESKHPNII